MGCFKVYAEEVNGIVYTKVKSTDLNMLQSFCITNNVFQFPYTANIVESDKVNIPQVQALIESFFNGNYKRHYSLKRGSVHRKGTSPADFYKSYAVYYTF